MDKNIKLTYTDIKVLEDMNEDMFKPGEMITIEEKVDGANCAIAYDADDRGAMALSRENVLNESLTLYGYYDWFKKLSEASVIKITSDGKYIVYGEWLNNHKIKYPDDVMFTFVMFDVYNIETKCWLPRSEWEHIADIIRESLQPDQKFMTVPLLYSGPFKGWDHVKQFVGMSKLNAIPHGEGVVVKSQERLTRHSNVKRMVKIVHEKYSEVHKIKTAQEIADAKAKKEAKELAIDVASQIVTQRRVEKAIEKTMDAGILRVDWDKSDIKTIMQNVPKRVVDDCYKEQEQFINDNIDIFDAAGGFGKISNTITSSIVSTMLKER